jgi:hypothetical protein
MRTMNGKQQEREIIDSIIHYSIICSIQEIDYCIKKVDENPVDLRHLMRLTAIIDQPIDPIIDIN